MNPKEQRERHNAITQIRSELNKLHEDVELVFEQTVAAFKTESGVAVSAVNELAASVTKRFEKSAAETADLLDKASVIHTEVLRRGFWGRMKWVVVGR